MKLNVLAVSAEAYPLAKTGGLGDAVSGMLGALAQDGVNVSVLLPAYRGVVQQLQQVREVAQLSGVPGGDAVLLSGHCPELGVPVLALVNDALYDRDMLYVGPEGEGFDDNDVRYAALSYAAACIARGVASVPRPHVVHAHDWHAALTPLYMQQLHVDDVRSVLTLHNLAFQGDFSIDRASRIGIDEDTLRREHCLDRNGRINFLKAGIRSADLISVVSHQYAREILTPEFGCGLENDLTYRRSHTIAIPNGIDMALWDPQADQYLPNRSFNARHMENKAVCKSALQHSFGIDEDESRIVLVMGSRLTTQKMADVAVHALPAALDAYPELQVCVMGQGDKALEKALREMAERYPGRCGVRIGFDEPRAHLLHAGGDILLHGSRFEPFGLTPLYSMRYGTVPIGSRVGGMVDTILDPGPEHSVPSMQGATGVLFRGDRPDDMLNAIHRAVGLYKRPSVWRAMQLNGMRLDFSWQRVAPAYLSAYQSLRPDVALDRIPERRRGVFSTRNWQPGKAPVLPNAGAAMQSGRTELVPRRLTSGQRTTTVVGADRSVA
ncbi:glycogen synthase GlgA [Allopusillimonas ginsengisoli]|uniref:glycogen synthase GlgA n=1 Tax=Allopusillimonas ginsengisoli TaxID=453575 RepID=UPI0039C1FDC3